MNKRNANNLTFMSFGFSYLIQFIQVACFPFDDHNCPPLQLVTAFCQSAYSWLKADLENVVVVHCKAGKARTGLMITSLLLFLKVVIETKSRDIKFHEFYPNIGQRRITEQTQKNKTPTYSKWRQSNGDPKMIQHSR